MSGADLIELVKALRAPYGLERSVKIESGVLFDDRFLISVHRDALGVDPLGKLGAIVAAQGAPRAVVRALAQALQGADVIHFGHETDALGAVRKIYFEYAAAARRSMAQDRPALVHFAYKWKPGREHGFAQTRYTWAPAPTRRELEGRVNALLPVGSAPRGRKTALALLELACRAAEAREILLMEVDEPGNARRSLDINLYEAELRLRDVGDLVATIAKDFAIPGERRQAVFADRGDLLLGHLSAGVGRDGQEFVTLYYGIEAH